MNLKILQQSLASPRVLVPERAWREQGCAGGRMPALVASALTPELAARAAAACPTAALALDANQLALDYALCIGCGRCAEAAPALIAPAAQPTFCGVARAHMVQRWRLDGTPAAAPEPPPPPSDAIHKLFGRALNIRQVDAGSCNGCEAEIAALANPYYDLERFGIHFVASPKHADLLLVTGPVTRNMAGALRATYEATPAPKLVVAVGACGCSAGLFAASPAVVGPVDAVIPVDTYIPGCPPTPGMLLAGLLSTLARR